MKRQPIEEEQVKIAQAIFGGDKVEATNLYISITQCGLTEAQQFVKTVTAELQAAYPKRFSPKKRQRRNFWHRLFISADD